MWPVWGHFPALGNGAFKSVIQTHATKPSITCPSTMPEMLSVARLLFS